MSGLRHDLSQTVPHQSLGAGADPATAVLDEVVEVTLSPWIAWAMMGLSVLMLGVGFMMGFSKNLTPSDAKVAPIVFWVSMVIGPFLLIAGLFILRSCKNIVIAMRPEGLTIEKDPLIEWTDIARAQEVAVSFRSKDPTYLAITLTSPGRQKRQAVVQQKGAMTKLLRKAAKVVGRGCDVLLPGHMLTETPANLADMINQRVTAAQTRQSQTPLQLDPDDKDWL